MFFSVGMMLDVWAGGRYEVLEVSTNKVGIEFVSGRVHTKYGHTTFTLPSYSFFEKDSRGKYFPLFDIPKE